jgi:hypothetical protein
MTEQGNRESALVIPRLFFLEGRTALIAGGNSIAEERSLPVRQ